MPCGEATQKDPKESPGVCTPAPSLPAPGLAATHRGLAPCPMVTEVPGLPPRRTAGSRVRTPVLSPGPVCETPVESPWGAGTALDAGRPRTCWTRR